MITSRDNETLKLVRKLLGQRKHRDESGLFAAEGEDLVAAAAAAGIEPVHLLVAGETIDEPLLAGVSTLPHPARAIGVYRRADLPAGVRDTCLALWRLADPGNVGALMRTADAFGAGIALSDGCADPLSPKALRASAGAIFRVPLDRMGRRSRAAHRARRPRRRPADRCRPRATGDVPPRRRARGAAGRARDDESQGEISLPGDAESLNVAAAGAIALYEASRRGGS